MSGDDPLYDRQVTSVADLDMRDHQLGRVRVAEVELDDLPLGKPVISKLFNSGWLKSGLEDAKAHRIILGYQEPHTQEDYRVLLQHAASLIIKACGGELTDTHFKGTPKRFADMFLEEFIPNGTITEALEQMYVEEKYDEMLIVKNIPIRSMCPHHLLPWFGRATVGYVPNERTVGLSKITRAIDAAGRGPKLQEAVTENITKAIEEVLKPLGAMAVIEAVHMCTLMRGVKTEQQQFTTSSCTGVFRDKTETRLEFLTLSKS